MIYSGKKDGNWGFFLQKEGVNPRFELSEEAHSALFDDQSVTCKIICWKKTGEPYLEDPPPPTEEEFAQAARAERDRLLTDTVDRLNAPRWEGMTGEEKDAWREYRKALLDITKQPGFPGNINWPQIPG
jgi:hypothetical protein